MRIFILILFFIPALGWAQQGNYLIEGKISGNNVPVRAYLVYNSGALNTIDSAAIVNGGFIFKGSVTEPKHANLIIDHKGIGLININPQNADMINIYLEKGNLHVNIKDSVFRAVLSGSKLNDDYQQLKTLIKPVTAKFNKMMVEYHALPVNQQSLPEVQANFTAKYKIIEEEQKQILGKYIKSNPGKYVSLDALKAYGGPEPNVTEVEPLFNILSDGIKNTTDGRMYAEVINRIRNTAIGSIAPDFIQNDPEGKPVQLSSFRGNYLLIDFWASWCGPCRQENPNIVHVYNQYKDKNFTVLGVSLDRPDAKKSWLKAIETDNLTWTQVSDLNYWKNAVAVQYGIKAIPQNYLLDPEGRIIATNLRGEDLRTKMAELIK